MVEEPYHEFAIGEFGCFVISDGIAEFPARSLFFNAPQNELDQELKKHCLFSEKVPLSLNCLLIRGNAQIILVDAGLGQGRGENAGRLINNLQKLGISADQIDMVILTHAHPDHVGGVNLDGYVPAFPSATYVISKIEWDYWHSESSELQAGEDRVQKIRSYLASIRTENLKLISMDERIIPSLRVLPAPGHTPGQIALELVSGTDRLLCMSDTVAHPIHLEKVGWNIKSDTDQAQAILTRNSLLERASDKQILAHIYHFPFPGLIYVKKSDNKWIQFPV